MLPVLRVLASWVGIILVEYLKLMVRIIKDVAIPIFKKMVVIFAGVLFSAIRSIVLLIKDDWIPVIRSIVLFIKDDLIPAITKFIDVLVSIPSRVKSALNQVIGFFEGMGNAGVGAINSVLRAWNSLRFKLPSKEIFGKTVGGGSLGVRRIPLVPNISIPRLAGGGIVNRPTVALVGEAGPEAVVPLGAGGGGGFGTTIVNNYYVGSLLTSQNQLDRMSVRANNKFARRRSGVLV